MGILYHIFSGGFLNLALFMRESTLIRIAFINDEKDLKNIFYIIASRYKEKPLKSKSEFSDIAKQLKEYINGDRRKFDIKYEITTTPFVTKVLKETEKVPYGQVKTYKEIAELIGNPKSYRAVGNALASNPLPIIIPCHRIVRSNGKLGGFGGRPDLKRKLLSLEGVKDI